MKTVLCLVLFLAGFSQVAVRASDGQLRAAVITKTTIAQLKLTQGKVLGGRHDLEAGQVFPVVSTAGALTELKIDGDRVALVSPAVIKIRECSASEFDAAQDKFNNPTFEAERKTIQAAYQTRVGGLQKMLGSSCPKKRGQASGWAQDARATRDSKLKELDQKEQALLKEALAWAAAK